METIVETIMDNKRDSKQQPKRSYRVPHLTDFGSVQGLTGSGGLGNANEGIGGSFYLNSF